MEEKWLFLNREVAFFTKTCFSVCSECQRASWPEHKRYCRPPLGRLATPADAEAMRAKAQGKVGKTGERARTEREESASSEVE